MSDLEFSKYLNISETSLEEVMCCLDLLLDDGNIAEADFEGYLREAESLGSQLIALGRRSGNKEADSKVRSLLSIVHRK